MSISPHLPTDKPDFDALRKALAAALGDSALVTDPGAMEPYLTEWRHLYHGATPFVVRPADTEGVATALRLAAEHGVAIVPQSGNTGLVGGQMPAESGEELLISTDRLTKIEFGRPRRQHAPVRRRHDPC